MEISSHTETTKIPISKGKYKFSSKIEIEHNKNIPINMDKLKKQIRRHISWDKMNKIKNLKKGDYIDIKFKYNWNFILKIFNKMIYVTGDNVDETNFLVNDLLGKEVITESGNYQKRIKMKNQIYLYILFP